MILEPERLLRLYDIIKPANSSADSFINSLIPDLFFSINYNNNDYPYPFIDLYFNNNYENYDSTNFNDDKEENLITSSSNVRNKDPNDEDYELITPYSCMCIKYNFNKKAPPSNINIANF